MSGHGMEITVVEEIGKNLHLYLVYVFVDESL
jgi:hypothetical protein